MCQVVIRDAGIDSACKIKMSFLICVIFSKGLSENITFKAKVNQMLIKC